MSLDKFTIVVSESSDWYVVPVDKQESWYNDGWDVAEEPPTWATYVQDPGHVEFIEWECTL